MHFIFTWGSQLQQVSKSFYLSWLFYFSIVYKTMLLLDHLVVSDWLCDPMDCSMPGFPVLHQFPELAQTHDHWVSDAIQPSHPLSSPSPPAFDLFQHQGLFQWVDSSHQVAKVLELLKISFRKTRYFTLSYFTSQSVHPHSQSLNIYYLNSNMLPQK